MPKISKDRRVPPRKHPYPRRVGFNQKPKKPRSARNLFGNWRSDGGFEKNDAEFDAAQNELNEAYCDLQEASSEERVAFLTNDEIRREKAKVKQSAAHRRYLKARDVVDFLRKQRQSQRAAA